MKLADSHCHLTDRAFAADLDEVLDRARSAGVSRVVAVASDHEDGLAALRLACRNDDVWCSAGVHPHCVPASNGPDMASVRDLASHPRCVAIGETGLDYFYENAPRRAQRRSFSRHAALAAELDLPLIVHSREAAADTAAAIHECAGRVRGVLHCFSGPESLLSLAMDAGWFVSFTGIATFGRFEEDLARAVRPDRYMIETDSPYLAPVPKRGRRNEPRYLVHVAEALARMRGMEVADLAAETWANTQRFFGLGDAGADGGPEDAADGPEDAEAEA